MLYTHDLSQEEQVHEVPLNLAGPKLQKCIENYRDTASHKEDSSSFPDKLAETSTFSLGSQPGAPRASLAGGGGEMHIHARQELREDARRSADLQPARLGRQAEPPRPAAQGGSVRESRH